MEKEIVPYQYSIIRYYHDVSTEEFLNIGVAIYCPSKNYFKVELIEKFKRLTDTFYGANGPFITQTTRKLNRRFSKITEDVANQQLELFKSTMPNLEQLLRLFLRRESSFQYSTISSGITSSSENALDETFENLYFDYIKKYWKEDDQTGRDDQEVWKVYEKQFKKVKVNTYLQPITIEAKNQKIDFDHAWKNAKWHLVEPVSFDMKTPGRITTKADQHLGKTLRLNLATNVASLSLLLGRPINQGRQVDKAYNRAKDILAQKLVEYNYKFDIYEEDAAVDLAHQWRKLIQEHHSIED